MRRAAALVALPLLAAVAVAGCSSSSSSAKPSSSTAASNSVVTATGSFGAAPKVTIPAEKAAPALYTKTVIQGSGSKLTSAETLEGNFVLYDWSGTTHKLLGSTYGSGGPTLFAGQMIPGLETALIGQPLGSRVLAVIPPKDAFGASGNSARRAVGEAAWIVTAPAGTPAPAPPGTAVELEEPDAIGGPVGGEGFADDP